MSDYPAGMTLRPIEVWPRSETRTRVRAPFSASWSSTLDLLDRELVCLGDGGRRAPSILQIAMRERDFRLNGLPRANSVPAHPGVILNVESNKGPLSMPCDKFDRWKDNLRAISLSLEALRRVDRYGTTPGNEQYRGWQAIEAPKQSPKQLIEFLAGVADMPPPSSADGIALAYKTARRKSHPDRNDGDQSLWDIVERAAGQLRREGWL
ncbi:molecular chaperone DnaJ [Mycolicibacterium komossense]|uniref:Molecular chaperone DnaJ n=1 Tax=Mycolicibacterium komossense TaxID=1779 RepID=A0ABT3CMW9_9MYCO|nr:molecular chaperone DnaJ [Mycolicibacterium komossense]MCV7230703.1 molecular chaperone DnaJ [Mycolicibacterium komossense]